MPEMKPPKFLADVNVEKAVVDDLVRNGYDIKWLPHYDCQLSDEDLLALANRERRILITNDKDFGELVFLQRKLSTGVILIRVRGQKGHSKVKLMKKLLETHHDKLFRHFVVITEKSIRFVSMEE
jgi:predicted nuclease of predicted toxin-antitoxin system